LKPVSYSEAVSRWARPERVVLAVSVDESGKPNIIAVGWKMFTSFSPPMIAISIGKTRYSHRLISDSGEFVLAVPGEDLAKEVLFCGTRSGRHVDKFKETGLTPVRASKVKPPLIKECIVNLECKVRGKLETGDHTIFVGEVVACWASDNERRNLLLIGDGSGYELILEGRGYRFGVVKK